MELKGTGTGAMAWPDCSFTEEVGLSCDVSSPLVYASSCNDSLAPLEVVKDDRAFLDPTAMTLSSSVSGLGLHDWMREDTIGNMADMDCSISSICGDLFPAKLEQELNLFPSVLDVSMCGKEILTWGSEEIDLDANDVVNAFQVKSESVQQNLLSRSLNPPGSAASSLISTQVVASPTVSIKKPAIGRLADLKKIIVKKPILDKAVERLGGGKDGALKLWKLIQIWLKHQKPQNRIPWAAMAESQEACLDISTSAQQKIVDELLRLPSDMDINFQDRLALMPGEFQNIPKTDFPPVFDAANVQLGIAGLNTAQNASAVPDHSNGQGFRSQTSLLPENGQQFAVTADSASTDLGCNYTNNVSVESLRLPAVPNIRATAPLTPPGLDVSVLHRTSAIQGHQINRNKTEERQGIVQPHVNGQLQEGMKQQAMMGSRSALDVPTSLPIIGAGVGESTMIGSSTAIAATTRAARKNRMARQRSSLAHHRRRLARTSCLRYPSIHTNGAYLNSFDLQNVDAPYALSSGKGRYWERNLKLFLEKELKSSDVGNLGRIVLPKKESESHLPNLTAREGVAILMEDINLSQSWDFRYRFWPNNKSRMYLLENTGEFVKSHSLEEGDFVMLYKDCTSGKYVIGGKKASRTNSTNITSLKTPANPCAPTLKKIGRDQLMKVAEGSPGGVGSSASATATDLISGDVLASQAEKMEETICPKRTSSSISTAADEPSTISNSIQPELSGSRQFEDSLVEIMKQFDNELPVMERFPSLDITAATVAVQVDEILDLQLDGVTNAAGPDPAVKSEE